MLWFLKQSFSSNPFLESKFVYQLGQMWIHIKISFLFMIGQHKLFYSLGLMILMLWFHKKSFSFHHYLELKFICQLGQTWCHIIISFLFIIRCHKLILLNGINDLMLWFHRKNFSSHQFLESKFTCQLE